MEFQALGLEAELVRAVQELGFSTPMPIQAKAIPVLLEGARDVVGLAQTGTGKTAAFGLPLLQRIDPSLLQPQAVVLCPTRELCVQIADDLRRFSRHLKGVHTAAVYGGAAMADQIRQLRRGTQVLAATPGRLADLLRRRALTMDHVSVAVLDEADEMLNMGFKEEIDQILGTLPARRRIWLFSATMPAGVAAIADNYLSRPLRITAAGSRQSPRNIQHICYTIRQKDRYEALKRILDFSPGIFGLVFCRTRKETQEVAAGLVRDGYDADALHGDLSQPQRDHVMGRFRQTSIRILVATDVAARGLDVDDISHVIHYNLPDETEVYTHRSGRTARAGKCGVSIALINLKEKYRVRAIEKRCHLRFEPGKLPDGAQICEKQLLSRIAGFVDTEVNDADIAQYLPAAFEALSGMDREALIKRLVSSEVSRFITHYRNACDINVKPRTTAISGAARPQARTNNRMRGRKTQRFFINVGRIDNINAGAIVRLVCERSGIRSSMIGQIDLKREFSFFEVEQRVAGRVQTTVANARLDGRAVKVREVIGKESNGRSAGGRPGHYRRGERRAVRP